MQHLTVTPTLTVCLNITQDRTAPGISPERPHNTAYAPHKPGISSQIPHNTAATVTQLIIFPCIFTVFICNGMCLVLTVLL